MGPPLGRDRACHRLSGRGAGAALSRLGARREPPANGAGRPGQGRPDLARGDVRPAAAAAALGAAVVRTSLHLLGLRGAGIPLGRARRPAAARVPGPRRRPRDLVSPWRRAGLRESLGQRVRPPPARRAAPGARPAALTATGASGRIEGVRPAVGTDAARADPVRLSAGRPAPPFCAAAPATAAVLGPWLGVSGHVTGSAALPWSPGSRTAPRCTRCWLHSSSP